MVVYLVVWKACWYTEFDKFEVGGEFQSRSLAAISRMIAGVVDGKAPRRIEDLKWDEPFFELSYTVARVEDSQGFFGLDVLAEREESQGDDVVFEPMDSLKRRDG